VRIRGIFAALYCALLTLGAWWIIQRNNMTTRDFVAAQELPFNRLLTVNDVVQAPWNDLKSGLRLVGPEAKDFVGRYVRGDVPEGAMLRLEATGSVPVLATGRGHVALVAALPRGGALGAINAGDCVKLQGNQQTPYKVLALLCPAGPQTDCAAMIDQELTRLTEIDTTPVTVVAKAACP
jgi:hypothetical protein